jgi:hypothetical protein
VCTAHSLFSSRLGNSGRIRAGNTAASAKFYACRAIRFTI